MKTTSIFARTMLGRANLKQELVNLIQCATQSSNTVIKHPRHFLKTIFSLRSGVGPLFLHLTPPKRRA